MTVLKKSEMVEGTLNAAMAILAWSFNVMLTGIEAATDWMGKSLPLAAELRFLAGRFRACLAQLRGDWEFYTVIAKVPKWNEVGRMCWKCLATGCNADILKYSRFDRHAPWRATRLTHEVYVAMTAAIDVPVIFAKIIGFRIEQMMADCLHTVELGIGGHILGNIMWERIAMHAFGESTQPKNITTLNTKLVAWMKVHKCKHLYRGKLTEDRIRTSGDWPKLKSKAAPIRSLAPFAVALAEAFLGADQVLVARQLVRFYEIIDSNGLFLTDDAKAEIKVVGSRLCRTYAKLATDAVAAGQKRWKCTPKLHLFLHLCEYDVELGNPRYYWCYADEDMVGQMITAAESCHPRTMPVAAMFKWLTVVFEENATCT